MKFQPVLGGWRAGLYIHRNVNIAAMVPAFTVHATCLQFIETI